MNPNESWIAEQARLLALEDGFGPGYVPARSAKAADAQEDTAAGHAAA